MISESRKKLLKDIQAQPARFYRVPSDVMRDRRFDDAERLQILESWRRSEQATDTVARLDEALGELQGRGATPHAAE